MPTFRQMQRWLRLSMKGKKKEVVPPPPDQRSAYDLVSFLSGRGLPDEPPESMAVFRNGKYTSACECPACRKAFRKLLTGEALARLLDAAARKFGAQSRVEDFIQTLRGNEEQADSDLDSDSSGAGDSGQPSPSAAPFRPNETAAQTAQQQAQAAVAAAAEQQAAANQRAAEMRESLNKLQKEAQARADPAAARFLVRAAKKALRAAKKQQAAVAHGNTASLTARRGVSRGLGRLRRVDVKTRQRMADLINRIIGKGAAGDQLTPIPVTDHRRLVKKMLSRRPLTNAFKEDSDSGRPAILFLPDISPSCAAQAQAACDIANAAGYAGVSGADVLVMPHFNGSIDSSCEEYMPWCNGRPMTLDRAEQDRLFAEATSAKRFNVRAVVIVGDHDGEDLYKQMTEQPKFRHIIWLHNFAGKSSGPELVTGKNNMFQWPDGNTKKLRLVLGCTNAEFMMRGLHVATS
jgi:hypothetical protein